MNEQEAAGAGELPPTVEQATEPSQEDRPALTGDEVEKVSDRVIRYYYDLSMLTDEQIQALAAVSYGQESLTEDEIEAMKWKIRGRVDDNISRAEPTLPDDDPAPTADEAAGTPPAAEEDIDAGELLAEIEPAAEPKYSSPTREIEVKMITLYCLDDGTLHDLNVLSLKAGGKSVQGLSVDKTQILNNVGSKHDSCVGGDDVLYQAPHSEKALKAMRSSVLSAVSHTLSDEQLLALSPEDTVEIFKRTKSSARGSKVPFRDVVVARIWKAYGSEAADLANDAVDGALMSAYGQAIKDQDGTKCNEVLAALRQAEKKSNVSTPATSAARPVESSHRTRSPAQPAHQEVPVSDVPQQDDNRRRVRTMDEVPAELAAPAAARPSRRSSFMTYLPWGFVFIMMLGAAAVLFIQNKNNKTTTTKVESGPKTADTTTTDEQKPSEMPELGEGPTSYAVHTVLELVGAPVHAECAADGTWFLRLPVRVPATLMHGDWNTMTADLSGREIEGPPLDNPQLLIYAVVHVRDTNDQEHLKLEVTVEGHPDLTQVQVVFNEVP